MDPTYKFILKEVWRAIVDGELTAETLSSQRASVFADSFMSKEHPTHVFVELSWKRPFHISTGVIDKNFFRWLSNFNPAIHLHSMPESFSRLLTKQESNYYVVEANEVGLMPAELSSSSAYKRYIELSRSYEKWKKTLITEMNPSPDELTEIFSKVYDNGHTSFETAEDYVAHLDDLAGNVINRLRKEKKSKI